VPYYACLTISAGNDLRNLMSLIMIVLPYRLVMTSGIIVPYYTCLTISAGNDLRNLMCLIVLVLPYRLVMTSRINVLIMLVLPYRQVMTSGFIVPYYTCPTILGGNDLLNYCALLCLSYHIGW
jgi:hypothetical protein